MTTTIYMRNLPLSPYICDPWFMHKLAMQILIKNVMSYWTILLQMWWVLGQQPPSWNCSHPTGSRHAIARTVDVQMLRCRQAYHAMYQPAHDLTYCHRVLGWWMRSVSHRYSTYSTNLHQLTNILVLNFTECYWCIRQNFMYIAIFHGHKTQQPKQ